MVSKWCTSPSRDADRNQSKIYGAQPNQTISLQICGELRWPQALRIYSRLLVNSKTRPNGCLGLLGVAWMFFLLRLTFWLGLVLVLLPREKTPESEKLPQIGASEAVQAATAAVSDMGQFCKRQPAACEVGGQAATMIGARAQEGAKKLYQIITDKKSGDHTGSIGGDTEELEAELAGMAPRDTLTSDDLAVEWRGVP